MSLAAGAVSLSVAASPASAIGLQDIEPPESGASFFGTVGAATILPNGNLVVADPGWDRNGDGDVGAVHVYDGRTHQRLSTLRGSAALDRVGSQIVVLEGSSNFVVISPEWDVPNSVDVGAVTWINGDTGADALGLRDQAVSPANSLVGSSANDLVGSNGATPLPNGAYVVDSQFWAPSDPGAVTWARPDGLTVGPVSAMNSIVGGSAGGDSVGSGGVTALANGNYAVSSPDWQLSNRGAVTWARGDQPTSLVLNAAAPNSVVGASGNDRVGSGQVVPLADGDFVVLSHEWHAGAAKVGAATWVNGATGPGNGTAVAATNSIVGTAGGDFSDLTGRLTARVTELNDGSYVVATPRADVLDQNGQLVIDGGAVTFADGASALGVTISRNASIVGPHTADQVGENVAAFGNGRFVVGAPHWNFDQVTDAGAVQTFGPGDPGGFDLIPANVLHGTTQDDRVGSSITVLDDGGAVVVAPQWDNPVTQAGDAGAVMWISATDAVSGNFGEGSGIRGPQPGDRVGNFGVLDLPGEKYAIVSPFWHNGPLTDAGAVTIVGSGPVDMDVSTQNSLYGTHAGDLVGTSEGGPTLVTDNGRLAVASSFWTNGTDDDAGAVTVIDPATFAAQPVSTANSLYGIGGGNFVGAYVVDVPGDGLLVGSPSWNSTSNDVGAVTWMSETSPIVGPVTTSNSWYGRTTNDQFGSGETLGLAGGAGLVWTNAVDHNGDADKRRALTYLPAGGGSGPMVSERTLLSGVDPADFDGIVRGQLADASVVVARPGRYTLLTPDGTPPVLPVPGNVTAVAPDSSGAIVTFPLPQAADPQDPQPVVACTPPSGSKFPVGVTTVVCTATNDDGLVGTTSFTVTVNPPGGGGGPGSGASDFVPLAPGRLADTRPSGVTVDGVFATTGVVKGGTFEQVPVAGRAGVPDDAVAVALNVTATEPVAAGYLTVYPCGTEPPTASNVNYVPGLTVPNAVVVKLGTLGRVCVFSQSDTHVVIDVGGYFPKGTTFQGLAPGRLMDTRSGAVTVDGAQAAGGATTAAGVTVVHVAGRAGVPADAAAVALNVTVTEPTTPGYVTVFPCGTEPPLASNLNHAVQQTVPNLVVAKTAADGTVCVFTQSPTHLVVDVTGWWPASTPYRAVAPVRLQDTRAGGATVDGQSAGGGLVKAGTVTEVQVAGRGGIPADATTAVLNVTVTETAGDGYVTVYPCGGEPPLASNLNHHADHTIPNAVIAKLSATGSVCIYNQTVTQLVTDINGYYR